MQNNKLHINRTPIIKSGIAYLLLILFWILVFDSQRILFSIHHFSKIPSFGDWLKIFFYSIRLDFSMIGYLALLPTLFLVPYFVFQKKFLFTIFKILLFVELLFVVLIHSGEINAYGEWNHKLTTRVFVHLVNPDEVIKTASFGETFMFFLYAVIEFTVGYRLFQWLFKKKEEPKTSNSILAKIVVPLLFIPLFTGFNFLFARGGWQQIPINIDSAYFSNNYVINDISVNSTYFFGKSYLLHKRTNIENYLPNYSDEEIEEIISDIIHPPTTHENYVLENTSPNLVFIILEGWSAKVINSITGEVGFTPEFDELTKDGILFTNIYSTSTTSEIGNASIFSGFPSIPEVSISMEPSKHRKLKTLNQTLKEEQGYTAGYLFGGDLKYGNIGGFMMEHDFDRIEDDSDFPSKYKRGKLNYHDEDLYELFLEKINKQSYPFIECAFTASTHSPYDYPGHENLEWNGLEEKFVNSLIYADRCLGDFMRKAKAQSWYKNTLFILVADHGRATPYCLNPSDSDFYHIPLLLFGEPLKEESRGTIVSTIGSQADIPQTLLYQMKIDTKNDYPWSLDLFHPDTPEFASHSALRGYSWVTKSGKFTYHLDLEKYIINEFPDSLLLQERKRCDALLQKVYEYYKAL